MDESVNDRHGHIVVGKEVSPAREVFVGRQDYRAIFVQAVYHLKQVVHTLTVHWQISELIDNQHVKLKIGVDALFEFTLHFGQF